MKGKDLSLPETQTLRHDSRIFTIPPGGHSIYSDSCESLNAVLIILAKVLYHVVYQRLHCDILWRTSKLFFCWLSSLALETCHLTCLQQSLPSSQVPLLCRMHVVSILDWLGGDEFNALSRKGLEMFRVSTNQPAFWAWQVLWSTGPRIKLLHKSSMLRNINVEDIHRLVTIVAGQHEIGANDVTRCYKHISFPSSHGLRNTPAQKKVKFFCGHGYHLHCINRWSQPWPSRKLPSCRQIDIAHLPHSRKPQPFLK